MIDNSGLITFFAKAVPPFDVLVHKPPVAVVVKPQLPPAVPPPVIENPVEQRAVAVRKPDELSARCRILLNEAQREIDRLRRSAAPPHQPQIEPRETDCPCESPASPLKMRKSYAVDPIGTMPPPREDAAEREVPGPKLIARPHVTNVGSLLNVLT